MLLSCLGCALPDINVFSLCLNVSYFNRVKSVIVNTLAEKKMKEPKDIRNFDYTSRSWTGKSPKQFLIDWCRKNLPKSPPPSFAKVAVGRYWKCKYVALKLHLDSNCILNADLSVWLCVIPVRVHIQRPDDVLEVCPTILTEDGMQAQHLGATLALYKLVKGQVSSKTLHSHIKHTVYVFHSFYPSFDLH